jgi:hypothetical protein
VDLLASQEGIFSMEVVSWEVPGFFQQFPSTLIAVNTSYSLAPGKTSLNKAVIRYVVF